MRIKKISFALFLVLISFLFAGVMRANAVSVDELKAKIDEKNRQKKQIEKEISELEQKTISTSKDAKTLEGTIKTLNASKDKIQAEIKATGNRIEIANLSIEKLGIEINNKQERIQTNTDAISSAFRKIDVAEGTSFVESILTDNDVSVLWDEVESLLRFQIGVKKNINELKVLRKDLQDKKNQKELNKKVLLSTKSELKDQNDLIESNKEEKDQLLSDTKNKESNYRKIIAEKKSLGESFAKELLEFESQLKLAIDPKSFPSAGIGVLFWPLDKVFITQYFGETEFAIKTKAYNGKGHNGVDFQAAPGTRVKAALDGIVEGTGDTDRTCKGASFGKWVFIRHSNGLSTLYGHLSLIKAVEGQRVQTGDVIGYSGNTGYSTGPHLHFSVYASQGVKIMDRQSISKGCVGRTYHMPIADLRAYLNPMLYL